MLALCLFALSYSVSVTGGDPEDLVIVPREEEFEIVHHSDASLPWAETSNVFTVDPDIYEDWRYIIIWPNSSHLFFLSNLETQTASTALQVVDRFVFDTHLDLIREMWSPRMDHRMEAAIVRALCMLGIMDQLQLLDPIRISTKFSFTPSTLHRFSQRKIFRLLSLTFKMQIVRVPFVMDKLRVIAREEHLSKDRFLPFLELIGDIGATHGMPWFANLWSSG